MVFKGKDKEHYNRWIHQLKEYIPLNDDETIIKYCLSYTLQSFRNNEDMNRFKYLTRDD